MIRKLQAPFPRARRSGSRMDPPTHSKSGILSGNILLTSRCRGQINTDESSSGLPNDPTFFFTFIDQQHDATMLLNMFWLQVLSWTTCSDVKIAHSEAGCCPASTSTTELLTHKCHKGTGEVMTGGAGGGRTYLAMHDDMIFAAVDKTKTDPLGNSKAVGSGYATFQVAGGKIVRREEACFPLSVQDSAYVVADNDYVWLQPKYTVKGTPTRVSRTNCSDIRQIETDTLPTEAQLPWFSYYRTHDMILVEDHIYTLHTFTSSLGAQGSNFIVARYHKTLDTTPSLAWSRGSFISQLNGASRIVATGTHLYLHTDLGLEELPLHFDHESRATLRINHTLPSNVVGQYDMQIVGTVVGSSLLDSTGNFWTFFDLTSNTVDIKAHIQLEGSSPDWTSESSFTIGDNAYFAGMFNTSHDFVMMYPLSGGDAKIVLLKETFSDSISNFAKPSITQYGAAGTHQLFADGKVVLPAKDGLSLLLFDTVTNTYLDRLTMAQATTPYSQRMIDTCPGVKSVYESNSCCAAAQELEVEKCVCHAPTSPTSGFTEWTINLHDSYGDGWDTAKLTVYGGYCPQHNFTMPGGASASFTLYAPEGSCLAIHYAPGEYPSENSYEVTSVVGTLARQGVQSQSQPLIANVGIDCPSLPPPPPPLLLTTPAVAQFTGGYKALQDTTPYGGAAQGEFFTDSQWTTMLANSGLTESFVLANGYAAKYSTPSQATATTDV